MRTELVDTAKVSLQLESGGDDQKRVTDVIFIHGLGGGSQTTWAFGGDRTLQFAYDGDVSGERLRGHW